MGTYNLCYGQGSAISCSESQRQYNQTQNLEPYGPKGISTKGWAGGLEGRATNLFKPGKVRKEQLSSGVSFSNDCAPTPAAARWRSPTGPCSHAATVAAIPPGS